MPTAVLGPSRTRGRTITEQFHAFDARNPHVYHALERMTARRLAAVPHGSASRTSSKTCAANSHTVSPD